MYKFPSIRSYSPMSAQYANTRVDNLSDRRTVLQQLFKKILSVLTKPFKFSCNVAMSTDELEYKIEHNQKRLPSPYLVTSECDI